jgi:hypothetical protein
LGIRLNFRIPYRVNFGQSLGIVGTGETLGNWSKPVALKWGEGDVWSVELNVAGV